LGGRHGVTPIVSGARAPTMEDGCTAAQARDPRSTARRRTARIGARMTTPTPARPQPLPTPETQHYWEGTALGELRLQRCRACEPPYFPPQPFCPACSSDHIEIIRSSGRASLHSYVITNLAAPGFDAPYVIAVVELDEGPRLLTNVVGVEPDPDALPLDLPVE